MIEGVILHRANQRIGDGGTLFEWQLESQSNYCSCVGCASKVDRCSASMSVFSHGPCTASKIEALQNKEGQFTLCGHDACVG